MLAGEAKSFKSWLALNLAYNQSDGNLPILVHYSPVRALSTLYFDAELGIYRLKNRLEVIHAYQDSGAALNNLLLSSKDMRIQLDTDDGIKRIQDLVSEHKPDVLVFDPLWNFHSKDENSATEMRKVLGPLQQVLTKYNCSAILVHHTAKITEYKGVPTRDISSPSSMRGSSALWGFADTIVMVEKPLKTQDTYLRLHFTLRDAADPGTLDLEFDEKTNTFITRKVNGKIV